jgi:hypothetical protein
VLDLCDHGLIFELQLFVLAVWEQGISRCSAVYFFFFFFFFFFYAASFFIFCFASIESSDTSYSRAHPTARRGTVLWRSGATGEQHHYRHGRRRVAAAASSSSSSSSSSEIEESISSSEASSDPDLRRYMLLSCLRPMGTVALIFPLCVAFAK